MEQKVKTEFYLIHTLHSVYYFARKSVVFRTKGLKAANYRPDAHKFAKGRKKKNLSQSNCQCKSLTKFLCSQSQYRLFCLSDMTMTGH